MKKKAILAAALIIAALTVSAAAMGRQQEQFSGKMIRLHVVANSDLPRDQLLKLQVRDAVLEAAAPVLEEAEDAGQAIAENLDLFRQAAEDCLRENGSSQSVAVSLGKERFPTRYYNSFALPSGVYTALRITIGEGDGRNWWCVVFPAICLPAAGELESAAATAGFTRQEIGLMTGEDGGYVLKFKVLELLDGLRQRIAG